MFGKSKKGGGVVIQSRYYRKPISNDGGSATIIEKILLYSYDGRYKSIQLNPDISVFTGDVRKGKTTIGDIIDYCFASHECTISKGYVQDRVSAVGLILNSDGDIFAVIRKLPPNLDSCYIIQSPKNIPVFGSFGECIDRNHLASFLSQKLGIIDKVSDIDGSFELSVRHAIPLCIQSQSDISNRDEILHGVSSNFFKKKHTRMALPYFLKIYDDQAIETIKKRDQLEMELMNDKADMKLNNNLLERLNLRIERLLNAAISLGLIENKVTKTNRVSKIEYLSKLNGSFEVFDTSSERLFSLQAQLESKTSELRQLNYEISNTEKIVSVTKDYLSQKENQLSRLNSVHLYNIDHSDQCPLCGSTPKINRASIDEINVELEKISNSLKNVNHSKKFVKKYEDESSKKRISLTSQIKTLREEIVKEYNKLNDSKCNYNAEVSKIIIEASFLLDSLNEIGSNNKRIETESKKEQIERLNNEIRNDIVLKNETTVINVLTERMTSYGRALSILDSNESLAFNLERMMPYIVSNDFQKGVVFSTWGSGYNLTCGHIITILALHSIIMEKHSTVPSFVFFDQITSSTPGDNENDVKRKNELLNFVIDYAKSHSGFQLILSDHFNSDDSLVSEYIVADWWGKDNALVPNDWPNHNLELSNKQF